MTDIEASISLNDPFVTTSSSSSMGTAPSSAPSTSCCSSTSAVTTSSTASVTEGSTSKPGDKPARRPSADQKTPRIRTVLTEQQLQTLRSVYQTNPRPDALLKEQLCELTGLSPRVIRVWFQNRRCKDKKKALQQAEVARMQSSGAKVSDVSVKSEVTFFVMIVTFPWNLVVVFFDE